jgi:hypothetical protein
MLEAFRQGQQKGVRSFSDEVDPISKHSQALAAFGAPTPRCLIFRANIPGNRIAPEAPDGLWRLEIAKPGGHRRDANPRGLRRRSSAIAALCLRSANYRAENKARQSASVICVAGPSPSSSATLSAPLKSSDAV